MILRTKVEELKRRIETKDRGDRGKNIIIKELKVEKREIKGGRGSG